LVIGAPGGRYSGKKSEKSLKPLQNKGFPKGEKLRSCKGESKVRITREKGSPKEKGKAMGTLKSKVTAKALADLVNAKRVTDRKEGKGKATYEVTVKQMEKVAIALNGKVMPDEVFGGSANDRREWCIANDSPIVKASDYSAKVNRERPDNTFRARLHAWQEIDDIFTNLSYQRVKVTSGATEGHDEVFIYRVA